jgi:hypothetical protein
MSKSKAIRPEMRYNQFMELPPQSFACADEPVAGPKKGQDQSNKDQVSHLKFPPVLWIIFYPKKCVNL